MGVKLKVVFQEIAVLVLLLVLTVFGIFRSESFRSSGFYSFLEWIVIVGVVVAIGAEIIAIYWTVKEAIKDFKLSKLKKQELAFTKSEKEVKDNIEEKVDTGEDNGLKISTVKTMQLFQPSVRYCPEKKVETDSK